MTPRRSATSLPTMKPILREAKPPIEFVPTRYWLIVLGSLLAGLGLGNTLFFGNPFAPLAMVAGAIMVYLGQPHERRKK